MCSPGPTWARRRAPTHRPSPARGRALTAMEFRAFLAGVMLCEIEIRETHRVE
jgi:hypothetical protein